MAGINLSDLLDQTTSNNYEIDNAQKAVMAQIGVMNESAQDEAKAVLAAGQDAYLVDKKLGAGMLTAQNDARQIAAHLGTNAEAASYRMLDLADQMTRSYDAANAQLDRVNADKSVGIGDGPIKYLAAQIKLKGDTAAYNGMVDKHNIASDFMDNIVAKTTAATAQQYAIADTRDAASIEAKADENLQKAAGELAKIKSSNAVHNIEGIRAVQAMSAQQLSNNFQYHNAQNQEEQQLFMREQRLAMRKAAEEALEEKKKLKQIDAEFISTISDASEAAGFGKVTENMYITATRHGGKMKQRMDELYLSGNIQKATGEQIIGANAGAAYRFIADTGAPLAPTDKRNVEFLGQVASDVANGKAPELQMKAIDPKNTRVFDEAVQAVADSRTSQMLSNIKAGDAANLYQAPPVQTIAAGNEAVATSALYQKVLRAAATASPDGFASDPKRLIDLGLDAVEEGIITYDEFKQGTSNLYQAATVLNRKTSSYAKVHLQEPGLKNPYRVKLSPILGYTMDIDAANPADLERYAVVRQVVKTRKHNDPNFSLFNITTGKALPDVKVTGVENLY